MTEKDYPTDRYGNPDGRDYHYRIPLNDDMAVRLASWALNGMVSYSDRWVVEWDGFSGNSLDYMGIKTHDSRGHLDGLAEYAHSPKWESMGPMTDIDEYRGVSGGTKIRGTFRVDPMSFNGVNKLQFKTTVGVTPSELEKAAENRGETWRDIQESLRWAKDDAMETAWEDIAEKQRQCDHEHTIDGIHGHTCEDCGAELDDDGELRH